MKNARDGVLGEIGRYFAAQDYICLGLVFGSVASGSSTWQSDLDVAVLAKQKLDADRRIALITELATLTGRAVDLIDLAAAGVAKSHSALVNGKVVFAADDYVYGSQLSRVLIDSADFLPYRERILRERRDAWLK